MGARTKLNWAYLQGALIIGAVAGGVFQSWMVFGVTAVVLVAGQIAVGEIRLDRRGFK